MIDVTVEYVLPCVISINLHDITSFELQVLSFITTEQKRKHYSETARGSKIA